MRLRYSWSINTEISYVHAKVAEKTKKTIILPRTYVYREALCVFQIAEYFVRRQSNAFIHGMTTSAADNSNTFRHGRQGIDAACVAC